MSGQENLNSTKQQMSMVEEALNEYEEKCGLPQFKSPCDDAEVNLYFAMPRDAIEKLSHEDCAQVAYRLAQLAFYIQRCLNRENARITWAETNLNKTISKECNQFDKFTKHEMKVELIKQQNSYANSLGKIIDYARQRVDRLTFLAASVKNLSDIMIANQRSKMYGTSRS